MVVTLFKLDSTLFVISFNINNMNFDTVGVLNDAILLNGIRLIAL